MHSSTFRTVRILLAFGFGLIALSPGSADSRQNAAAGSWQSSDGKRLDPFQMAKSQPVVMFFVLSDCPIANKFAPEITRIIDEYRPKGLTLKVVYVDAGMSPTGAQKHADDYGYKHPSILDPKHTLAKKLGVTVSPEAVILGRKGEILYRGRIDDRAADIGKLRPKPTRADLRLALDAVLSGKKVAIPRTKAVGCIL